MKVSIIALAANLSACNDHDHNLADDGFGSNVYRIEGDAETNKLLGTWQSCDDIGDGLYVKTYYTFDERFAVTTMEGSFYSNSSCTQLSLAEEELEMETLRSNYTIEEVNDEIYFLNFTTERGNTFFTSLRLDNNLLLEAKAHPEGLYDGSSGDHRANYFEDSKKFRKI